MAKSFTDREKDAICAKLIESCELCWSKYGYKKTNVSEICEMSGVSVGAFYIFYPSKELLFVATAKNVGQRLAKTISHNMPAQPTKSDLISAMKSMIGELAKVDWFLSISSEFEILARKLPPDFVAEQQANDLIDFSKTIKNYGLKPVFSMDKTVAILKTLMSTLRNRKLIGDSFDKSFELIIDSTIDNLFE